MKLHFWRKLPGYKCLSILYFKDGIEFSKEYHLKSRWTLDFPWALICKLNLRFQSPCIAMFNWTSYLYLSVLLLDGTSEIKEIAALIDSHCGEQNLSRQKPQLTVYFSKKCTAKATLRKYCFAFPGRKSRKHCFTHNVNLPFLYPYFNASRSPAQS